MSREQLIRQWRLIEALQGKHFGTPLRHLLEESMASRATLYRDLALLEEAGVPILREERNGEVFLKLEGDAPPSLRPTPAQMMALTLARTLLGALEGTSLVDEYDALLARWRRAPAASLPVQAEFASPSVDAAVLRTIEESFAPRRRLCFVYAGAEGEPGERTVDPVNLRIARDNQLYLDAHDTQKNALRTFKPARMSHVRLLDERAPLHPEHDEHEAFANAIKTWSAPAVEVTIVLSARKARFVNEWPLSKQQRVEPRPDGSVLVHATVAGHQEVSKWVLSWGRDAEVLSPPELRDALREELSAALDGYQRDPR